MENNLAAGEVVTQGSTSDPSAVSEPSRHPETGEATAVSPKRRRARCMVSPYPIPPRELAGKWVAWSRYRIVASGETLGEVMDSVASEGITGASYELLPSLSRGH
jgi:hypothetical protein